MGSAYPSPQVGDIVWCRFPEDASIHPGPKPRPANVLSVMDESKPVRVRVVYGTSQKITPLGKGAMVIKKEQVAAFKQAGLSHTTKFDFNKVLIVPYTTAWFDLAPLGEGLTAATPQLGTLHAALVVEVQRAAKEAGLIRR